MNPRVLLIHGDRSMDEVYKNSLRAVEPRIELSVAETPDEVARHPLPEVIVLDLEHSRHPSLEILGWLKSREPYAQVPVITLSSPNEKAQVNRAFELGANSCLMKNSNGFLEETARGIASFARVLKANYQAA